ncbi:hypothetical protein VCHA53O466_50175 [Vibrio chagasii]|nr:hypothetical protein VCHA53O466_50175 [Vibrio chagasii]
MFLRKVLNRVFGKTKCNEVRVDQSDSEVVKEQSLKVLEPDYYYDIMHVNDICGGYTSVDIYDNATREHLVRGTVPRETSPFEYMKTMLKDLPCYQDGKTYKDIDTIIMGDDYQSPE